MTYHPRATWATDPAYPVTGPPMNWRDIDTVVIHYTAAVDLPDGDLDELGNPPWYLIPPYLRSINRMYWNKPDRYAIGYGFPIDWLGGVWEARGFDIKNAANKDHNAHTVSLLMLVDGADPATPEALAAARTVIAQCEAKAGRWLKILGHDELRNPHHPTGCPGRGLLAQIHAGMFSPRYHPTPPEPPEDFMDFKAIHARSKTKGEALVVIHMKGYDSTAQAATVSTFTDAEKVDFSDAEYDALIKAFQS